MVLTVDVDRLDGRLTLRGTQPEKLSETFNGTEQLPNLPDENKENENMLQCPINQLNRTSYFVHFRWLLALDRT